MTPAHRAFREKRAEEFAKLALSINCKYSPEAEREQYRFGILFGFKNGMEAEHEVARLMGRIEGVTWAAKFADENYWISPKQRESLYEEARRLEAQLAAFLEGK